MKRKLKQVGSIVDNFRIRLWITRRVGKSAAGKSAKREKRMVLYRGTLVNENDSHLHLEIRYQG